MCFVLLVEDNSTFRKSLKEMLSLRFPGLEIEEASDGEEALQKLETIYPDLIFMDIRLPGKNGLELTREIKGHYPDLVISIFTSYDLPEYRKIAEEYGADHFLLKDTLTGAEIAAMVKAIIAKKERSSKGLHRKREVYERKASIH